MKKSLLVILTLVILGCVSTQVHARKQKKIYKNAVSLNIGDLLIPPDFNGNAGFLTFAYERAFGKKFSLYVPLSTANYYGTSVYKIELHPRLYLIGRNMTGLFISGYGGIGMADFNFSTAYGATAGLKLRMGRRWFLEAFGGLGVVQNDYTTASGMISGFSVGMMF